MRDVDAFAMGDLPDRFARPGADHISIKREKELVCHGLIASVS